MQLGTLVSHWELQGLCQLLERVDVVSRADERAECTFDSFTLEADDVLDSSSVLKRHPCNFKCILVHLGRWPQLEDILVGHQVNLRGNHCHRVRSRLRTKRPLRFVAIFVLLGSLASLGTLTEIALGCFFEAAAIPLVSCVSLVLTLVLVASVVLAVASVRLVVVLITRLGVASLVTTLVTAILGRLATVTLLLIMPLATTIRLVLIVAGLVAAIVAAIAVLLVATV